MCHPTTITKGISSYSDLQWYLCGIDNKNCTYYGSLDDLNTTNVYEKRKNDPKYFDRINQSIYNLQYRYDFIGINEYQNQTAEMLSYYLPNTFFDYDVYVKDIKNAPRYKHTDGVKRYVIKGGREYDPNKLQEYYQEIRARHIPLDKKLRKAVERQLFGDVIVYNEAKKLFLKRYQYMKNNKK